jgi:hypothetical protein
MSIAALNQVYDEVRRLGIAGSNLASGDFRLKKIVPILDKSAEKAPVFGKVSAAITKLTDGPSKESPTALLELSTLTSAILYTQGETGKEGKLEPLATQDFGLVVSNTSARMMKPLIEALTSTGSGRMELIKEAYERGAFKDLRLVKLAIKAIEDPYAEIGDFVADKVLPMYGMTIFPEIQASFDIKGKGDDARRLKLMHKLAPASTKETVTKSLEEGSTEVKLAAIECLKGSVESIPFLLDAVKAKAKDVRSAALRALAPIDDDKVVETLITALKGKDADTFCGEIGINPNKKLKAYVIEALNKNLDAIPKGLPKEKPKLGAWTDETYRLLQGLKNRKDSIVEKFLIDRFAQRDSIVKYLKSDNYHDGEMIVSDIIEMLVEFGSTATFQCLVDAREQMPPEHLDASFIACAKTLTPKEVYANFEPIYVADPKGKSKDAQLVRERSEEIGAILDTIGEHRLGERSWDTSSIATVYRSIELDPRWMDAAIAKKDTEVVVALMHQPHPKAAKYLSEIVSSELSKKKNDPDYSLVNVLRALIRINHPQISDQFVEFLQKTSKSVQSHWWWNWHLASLIPTLPKEAIPKLEAIIPTINEKLLDTMVSAIDTLKQKYPTKTGA